MTFIFACGGTGGHIFPAISVAEELRLRDPDIRIIFISGKKDIESEIFRFAKNERVTFIESAAYQGLRSFVNPAFLIKLIRGFLESKKIVSIEKPQMVIGFGGYVSFPVLMAAQFMGIRTLVHEQNVMPGKANRWIAKRVSAVALSFSETKKYLKNLKNSRVTGNPIRRRIEQGSREEALPFFGFEKGKKTVLILGGSQGAESINRLYLDSLPLWSDEMKGSLQVLHLCGILLPSESERISRENGVFCRAFSFFDRMDLAYAAADFCVGRAGATFLAEVQAKKIPSLLIPYPYAGGHQLYNAQWVAKTGMALIAEQKDLNSAKFYDLLKDLWEQTSAGKFAQLRTTQSTEMSSRQKLADYIMELVKG
jgi:UDP-N-acetylglucosamine--N-acetylmuramyl-(pentapeptide) pyrophosphoryl-undecaprenol N-acetylglucosamine transferase